MQYSVFSIRYKKRDKKCDASVFHTEYCIQNTEYSPRALRARGVTVILVLAFMGVFALITGSIASYVLEQGKYGRALFAREQALHIAEAGLEYYKWWLGRQPSSVLTTGVGLVSPSTYTVNDPEGGTLGSAVITATPSLQCGAVQWIDLASRGTSNSSVGFPRTLLARYMKPSVAEYSYLFNNTVWIGSTDSAIGPQHANNGFRMDGSSNSTISSAVSQVYCDGTAASLGCNGVSPNPGPGLKNGVFGLSLNQALWQYGIPPIDFPGMAVSFPTLKNYASQNSSGGIMLGKNSVIQGSRTWTWNPPTEVGGAETNGYHLVFKSDGTVDIYRVTATNGNNTIYSGNISYGSTGATVWKYTYPVIATQSQIFVANVLVPSDCSLIFSQAKTWIDGTVKGKVTLIVADPDTSFVPDIIINDNISYTTNDGSSGLTAVAEGSIRIGLVVPDTLSVRGIFVAQTGNYSRDYYYPATGYLPSAYYPYATRTRLNLTGTVVSNQRAALCYGGTPCVSGFNNRTNAYDRVLASSPPPFTPATSADYKLSLWREQ
ncbi:MAG: hypothetical protein Q7S01_06395 [bacterium]|nr:hypothetical protein [bacterium]